MPSLYEPPVSEIIAGLLALVGFYSGARGGLRLARGLRQATASELVRGIRGCIIAVVAGIFALGVLSAETGFLILGAIILVEELYETGILAALIRLGDRGGT